MSYLSRTTPNFHHKKAHQYGAELICINAYQKKHKTTSFPEPLFWRNKKYKSLYGRACAACSKVIKATSELSALSAITKNKIDNCNYAKLMHFATLEQDKQLSKELPAPEKLDERVTDIEFAQKLIEEHKEQKQDKIGFMKRMMRDGESKEIKTKRNENKRDGTETKKD